MCLFKIKANPKYLAVPGQQYHPLVKMYTCKGGGKKKYFFSSLLGKPVPTIIDEFLEKFQRGEGGSFPIQKISLQNF